MSIELESSTVISPNQCQRSTNNLSSNLCTEPSHLSKSTTNDLRAKKNLTLMIVSISFLYTFGTIPWAAYYSTTNFTKQDLVLFDDIGTVCLILLVGCKFFLYYRFNRMFRNVVKNNFVPQILVSMLAKR